MDCSQCHCFIGISSLNRGLSRTVAVVTSLGRYNQVNELTRNTVHGRVTESHTAVLKGKVAERVACG